MIDLSQVCFDLPGRRLFDDLSFRVNDTDRVALVGPNGSGKSTLLKLMLGTIGPDGGQVARTKGSTVGYLPQEGLSLGGRSVVAEARSVFEDLLQLRHESSAIEERLEAGEADERLLVRYHEITEELRHRGGYEIDARVAAVLDGLGFERSDWERDAGTLSGGWQMRLALAKLLIQRPSTLLLDEPNNHLDLLANNWLEEYLGNYPGAFVLVSHDRHFLDNVVSHVAELRFARLRLYPGNYTRYLSASGKELESLEERKRRQDERIEKVERFIQKFRYKATKAKQVQSRIKELERIDRIELPQEAAEIRFRFPEPPRSGRRVLELEGVGKAYGSKVVFEALDLLVERGDRLALVGPNGAGKSTLMRLLAGRESLAGERRVGHNVALAYFAQDEGARLDPGATVLEEVSRVAPIGVVSQLRNMLAAFLFRGDDVFKPVGVLSGGEKTRVALAKMLLQPHNLLLLDEPTNHLDLASKEVLLTALLEFTGTLVIVSHDRYFLDRIATKIADVGDRGVLIYPGGYEDYLDHKARHARNSAPPPAEAGKPRKGPGTAKDRPAPPRPDRRADKEAREAARRREALEKLIEQKEAELKDLETRMCSPGFYEDPAHRGEAERHQGLLEEIQDLYRRWDGEVVP